MIKPTQSCVDVTINVLKYKTSTTAVTNKVVMAQRGYKMKYNHTIVTVTVVAIPLSILPL